MPKSRRNQQWGILLFKRLAVIAASASTLFGLSAHAATVLYFTGTDGSWVSGGETRTLLSEADGGTFAFQAFETFGGAIAVDINNYANDTVPFQDQVGYSVEVAPRAGETLGVGLYLGGTRFPFQDPSEPGLNFSGNGRGNNMQTGYFNILELEIDDMRAIVAFAVDLLQYTETSTTEYSWVSLRFNSDIALTLDPILNPAPVPVPGAVLLFAPALLGLGAARRRPR